MILLAISLFILLFYKFKSELIPNIEIMADKYKDGPLSTLLNGSGINNIPSLVISSTNKEVEDANRCAQGPIYFGETATIDDCVKKCMSSKAHNLIVADNNTFYQNLQLKPGAYCTMGPRPECNTNTTRAMLTINSVTCVSKYPSMFGGELGNLIVACNNSQYKHPKNILWDFLENEIVNPYTTLITEEDEILGDGNYRFRCKYDGVDQNANKYIEHPINRFHPIRDYCKQYLYAAHPDVKMEYHTAEGKKYIECNCGDFEDTRVKNIDPLDKSSPCSSHIKTKTTTEHLDTTFVKASIPYECFTINSPITDITKKFPCPIDKFTINTSTMDNFDLEYFNYKKKDITFESFDKIDFHDKRDNVYYYYQYYDNVHLAHPMSKDFVDPYAMNPIKEWYHKH